jgi:hypothetical protein
MAIRFISKATVKNKLPRSSNIWDGTAVYNPFTLVGNYDALATVTVPSGGLTSITFAGIPQTGYSHLQVRCIARGTSGSATDNWYLQLNEDTATNYSQHYIYGNGTTVVGSGLGANISTPYMGLLPSTANTANAFGASVVDILDYTNTNKFKTMRSLSGYDNNGTDGYMFLYSSNWRSTNAINSIKFTPVSGSGSFAQYTQFALYGVKA